MPLRRALLASALVAVGGCGSSEPVCPGAGEICIAVPPALAAQSPVPLGEVMCGDASPCPSGTVCDNRPGELGRCRLFEDRDFRRNALIVGFNVPRFDLGLTVVAGRARLVLDGPADAELAQCVIFGCAPALSPVCEAPERVSVRNHPECALATATTRQVSGAIELDSFELVTGASRPAVCGESEPPPRLITLMSAGCWFYDDIQILGATELVLISTSSSGAVGRSYVDRCASVDPSAPQTCILESGATDVYGTCHRRVCRPRCIAGGCPTDWVCRRPDHGLVGVCAPPGAEGDP